MKKIISIILSLTLLCSMFVATTVLAADEIVTDASHNAAALLKEEITKNYTFDDNYFFMGKLVNDPADGTKMGVKISTTSETDVSVVVGLAYEGVGAMLFPGMDAPVTINASQDSYVYYGKYSDMKGYYIGVALQNASSLSGDVTVKLEVVEGTTEGASENVIHEFKKTFEGPVSFGENVFSKTASVLTNMKFGTTVYYSDVVDALTEISTSSDEKTALNAELAKDYDEDGITNAEEIAKIVTNGNANISLTNAVAVSIPYAVLASVPTEEGTAYVVEATDVTETEDVKALELPILVDNEGTENDVKANDKFAYDIKIKAGNSYISNPLVQQKVIVKLPDTWDLANGVQYYHNNEWKDADISGTNAVIYTDSFSTFVFAGKTATADNEDTRAEYVRYELVKNEVQDVVDGTKYTIVAVPVGATNAVDTSKQIIDFTTASVAVQFGTTNITDGAMKNLSMELVEIDGISITNDEYIGKSNAILGEVKFVVSAEEGNFKTAACGAPVALAEIIVKGTGKFSVNTYAYETERQFWMNSLEDNYAISAEVKNFSKNDFEIEEKKCTLTFDMTFKNRIESTDADYIGMTIEIEGSISGTQPTVVIGSEDMPVQKSVDSVTATSKAIELTANETYKFVVRGAGFRTFRGSVYLDENKTIKLWNNAKTSAPTAVVEGDSTTNKYITFLVGDIYEDGIVDIYDLSAVTAYYSGNKTVDAEYVTYDLNRDGKINTADIAYVQDAYGY